MDFLFKHVNTGKIEAMTVTEAEIIAFMSDYARNELEFHLSIADSSDWFDVTQNQEKK